MSALDQEQLLSTSWILLVNGIRVETMLATLLSIRDVFTLTLILDIAEIGKSWFDPDLSCLVGISNQSYRHTVSQTPIAPG